MWGRFWMPGEELGCFVCGAREPWTQVIGLGGERATLEPGQAGVRGGAVVFCALVRKG